MAVHSLTALDDNGERVPIAFIDRNSAYALSPDREQFAQALASGADPMVAYCKAHGHDHSALEESEAKRIKSAVGRLLADTTVVLRVQELKRPVLRKLRRKFEYSLQKALAQCEVAYDLAYEKGDVGGLLKCVDMQARLAKLLSEEINVTHKYGLLDDADTQTLLEMRKEAEVRLLKQKRLAVEVISVV